MAIPRPERKQYKIGKYDVIAQPAIGSAHMMRYTILLNGKRLGALLSVPTESDCRFLEQPPPVPPLKTYKVIYRPGRPKKNAVPPPAHGLSEGNHAGRHDEAASVAIPWLIKGQKRY
jgi:hypothetical protein